MSSTNRSDARKEHIADYYVTPIDKIVEFLEEFKMVEPDAFIGTILDPCSGGDTNHPMSYPTALQQIGVHKGNILTVDVRQDSLADIKANYLDTICSGINMIITNPPFNIARDIIEKALDDVEINGFVVMLLRLNFLEGINRFDLWQKHMAKYIFVHHRRMSFTDDRKTDSIAYAHFVWQKGYYPEFSEIKVI